jgi:hypothetical protein
MSGKGRTERQDHWALNLKKPDKQSQNTQRILKPIPS